MPDAPLTVTIVKLPETPLVGMKIFTDMERAWRDCPNLWSNDFGPRMREIPYEGEMRSYGLSFMTGEKDGFAYWAAMPIREGALPPKDMERTALPAGSYAEVAIDSLEALGAAYDFLYKWTFDPKNRRLDMNRPSYEFYPADHMKTGRMTVGCPVVD